jgi:hypothetical protein
MRGSTLHRYWRAFYALLAVCWVALAAAQAEIAQLRQIVADLAKGNRPGQGGTGNDG